MRAVSSFILHFFCVAALVVSCGLPEALHDLGHALTHTANESVSASAGVTPTVSATEVCWIQSLVASVSQLSASTSANISVLPLFLFDVVAVAPLERAFLTRDLTSWQSSRGPPAV